MEGLYRSPLRVYLVLGLLSLVGVWSSLKLPVSLFPNSTKPQITLCFNTELSPDAFLRSYGSWIEEQLRAIRRGSLGVENVVANYAPKDACFDTEFKWGSDPDEAMREVQAVANIAQGRLPQDSRDRMRIYNSRENGGFLALSFFSNERTLTDLYNTLEPVLSPKLGRVRDAEEAVLFNPQRRQLLVELKPEALAATQLFPADVAAAITRALESYNGGSITVDTASLGIELPRPVKNLDDFRMIQISTASGRSVALGEIARLDLTVPLDSARVFKTSGAASVILWASPKPGGNVKSMAEEVMKVVDETMPTLPKDIQYKALVDPSEFIRSAVGNVAREVGLAAFLAVVVLFLFVGNLKNVVTAAIEIPLSIVLAFILMKLSGMNLNLISLGGLALSAGMNVDASVVVMENIFRHFENLHAENKDGAALSFEERLRVVVAAVSEVRFAVIASTIASLVVFLPLAFTSDLSYAVLGDLAKAVVFSHGFSAIVALILVPTIRLQMIKNGMPKESPSFFEKPLRWTEDRYALALGWFLERGGVKLAAYAALSILLALLIAVAIPRLPKEIIGKPDTDWLMLGVSTSGNTLVRQMEAQTEQVESQLLEMLGDKVLYTFTQVHRPNNSQIMFRLRDKREMEDILKKVEETFTNTPLVSYWSDSWNPAELPIPDPPDFEVSIRGSDNVLMAENARDLYTELQERKLFSRVWLKPNAWTDKSIVVRPKSDQWQMLAANGMRLPFASPFACLADLTRTATVGRTVARVDIDNEDMDIFMRFTADYVNSPEELAALPVGMGTRILPLKALADVNREEGQTPILRENGRQLFALRSRIKKDDLGRKDEILKEANQIVTDWPNMIAARLAKKTAEERSNAPAVSGLKAPSLPSLQIEDAQKEMDDALKQLITAITLSIVLIFLTMVFQFGSVMNSLLVLVAVPLGFIGVIASLWLFRSTLSLNSMLGVILLNGLSVANSIILVDFLQRSVASGIRPKLAAVQVARARLRPILMTSMTTGLGMLPVALGMGEGGRILQPLGIAVAGGLGFSMVTTLFIVPALQVSWLEFRERVRKNPGDRTGQVPSQLTAGLAAFFFAGLLSMPSTVRAEEKPFSFKDAWTSILDRSLRLKSQQLSVEIASQRRLEKVGGFLPSLSLKGAETRSGDPFVGPRRSAEIDVDVNVFRSGRDLALTSAASKDLESAQNRFHSEHQAVELQAAESLVHVIARAQQRKIVENIVKLKSESLRVARERFDRGLLPLQEVDKVAIELENSRARLIDAETSEAEARGQLRALLGHDAVEVLWPWKDALSKGQRLEETVFDLQARPDWKSAQATIEAEASRKRAALSRFFPSLDFTFSYGNADLSRSDRRDWAAIATFSIPLFDGLSSYTGYQTQSLTLQAAQIQAEIVKRDAPVEIDSLRQSHRAARDSALVREKTAKLSEKLFDDNFQRFRLGRTTVNELAIDQNRLFETELLAVEGWSNAHLTFVRLCHALGKSVSPSGQCAH